MIRKAIQLSFAAGVLIFALRLPEPLAAQTCAPQGTRYFKTSFPAANQWLCDAHGPMVGVPCGDPPEQNYCFLGEYWPPTDCCNGYHEETEPEDECGSCFYCRDVEYVCD